jgi:hypothetical protein
MLSEANSFWGCANFIYGNDVTMHSTFLCDMPLFHTAGLFAASRVPIQAGGCVLISKGPMPGALLGWFGLGRCSADRPQRASRRCANVASSAAPRGRMSSLKS